MTACIVGWSHGKFGKLDGETSESLIVKAASEAIAHAGIEPKDVDVIYVGNMNGGFVRQEFHSSLALQAHPDLRFTIDDLIAEADRVTIRWTLHGTNTGPMLGRPPTGQPVELAAIVIFRIADGKIAERWAGWKPGRAPVR